MLTSTIASQGSSKLQARLRSNRVAHHHLYPPRLARFLYIRNVRVDSPDFPGHIEVLTLPLDSATTSGQSYMVCVDSYDPRFILVNFVAEAGFLLHTSILADSYIGTSPTTNRDFDEILARTPRTSLSCLCYPRPKHSELP